MRIAGFDWGKGNRTKCEEHGIRCSEIESFFERKVWVAPDPKHSEQEERFLAVGRSDTGRPMVVAFTFRDRHGEHFIRPISARYMHAKEVRKYEEAFAEDGNK